MSVGPDNSDAEIDKMIAQLGADDNLHSTAIRHHNGWVRLWAMRKIVNDPSPFFADNCMFFVDVFLSALNSNDTFWRLLEKNNLFVFLEKTSKALRNVSQSVDIFMKANFLNKILEIFTEKWSPCSLFYVSCVLAEIGEYPVFGLEQFDILWSIYYVNIEIIKLLPLKLFTLFNFSRFFIYLTSWSLETIQRFSLFLRHCAPFPNLHKAVLNELFEVFSRFDQSFLTVYDFAGLLDLYFCWECGTNVNDIETSFDESALYSNYYNNYENGDNLGLTAPIIWVLAKRLGFDQKLLSEVESLIVELTESDSYSHRIKEDLLLLLWIKRPDSLDSTLVGPFLDIVRNYLNVRLFSLKNESRNFCRSVGKNVILPVLRFLNEKSESEINKNDAIIKSIFSTFTETGSSDSLSSSNEVLIYSVAEECFKCKGQLSFDETTTDRFIRQLADGMFKQTISLHQNINRVKTVSECSSIIYDADLEEMMFEHLRIQKIKLFLCLLETKGLNNKIELKSALNRLCNEDQATLEEVLETFVEWALFCSDFNGHGRIAILKLVKLILQVLSLPLPDDNAFQFVNSMKVILLERRKTENYVLLVKEVLNVLLERNVLEARGKACKMIFDLIDSLVNDCHLNLSLGFVVAESLFNARQTISLANENWTRILVELAIFGPVLKKSHQTLFSAYEFIYQNNKNQTLNELNVIYGELQKDLSTERIDKLHLAARSVRLYAISTILSLTTLREGVTVEEMSCLIDAILSKSSKVLSTNNINLSISFVNLQITRLLQTVLLIVNSVTDQPLITKIFDFCIEMLQQVRLRSLFVEWILLCIFANSFKFFERFIELESMLARKQPEALSAWINIVQQHYRCLGRNHMREAFLKVLPWCTTQIFSVRCVAVAAIKVLYHHFCETDSIDKSLSNESNGSIEFLDFSELNLTDTCDSNMPRNIVDDLAYIKCIVDFYDDTFPGNANRIISNLCADFYFKYFSVRENFDFEAILRIFPQKTGLPSDEQFDLPFIIEHFQKCFTLDELKRLPKIICKNRKLAAANSFVYLSEKLTENIFTRLSPVNDSDFCIIEPKIMEESTIDWPNFGLFNGVDATELYTLLTEINADEEANDNDLFCLM